MSARLQLESVVRVFGTTRAADGVSFAVGAGEIVGFVGHNGAGKSTVSKIIAGSDNGYSGTVRIEGEEVRLKSPQDAMSKGIGLVPQRLAVVETLTVRDNLTLGQGSIGEPRRSSSEAIAAVARDLGIEQLLGRRVGTLRPGMQRLVMIGRVLLHEPRLLILDEPTAAFSIAEVERLFEIVRRMRAGGISVIFVSHRLDEVLELSDRVVAMSRGAVIADRPAAELSKPELVDLIAGRHVEHLTKGEPVADASVPEGGLRLNGVSVAPSLHDIEIEVGRGEIVGITGLVGSGRTGLLNALWGVGNKLSGDVTIDGKPFRPSDPRSAIRRGIAYLPENRASNSLFGTMTSIQNVTLPAVRRFRLGALPWVNRRRESEEVADLFERLSVQPQDAALRRIAELSGGNQQKSLIARWLLLDLDVYLLDEPTEGVDVAGRQEIYGVMRRLAEEGKSVLVSSSDVEEVVDQCSRVYVMREGTIAGVLTGSDLTLETVSRSCIA